MTRPGARRAFGAGVAVATLAVVLALPAGLNEGARPLHPVEPELGALRAAGAPEALREEEVSRIEDLLFARMPGADPYLHEALARAIFEESQATRLDPALVLAVIEVESGFATGALSGAGALGLMQLLPGTMQRELDELGMPAADLHDPVANVRAGVRYLRRCLDSYPDTGLALMAYNTGPNRLLGFLQDGDVPEQVAGYARRVLSERRRLRQVLAVGGLGALDLRLARNP